MIHSVKRVLISGFALSALIGPASASSITTSVLDQYNLITFGSVSSSSEVEGRALIGGNLSGTSNYYIKGTQAPASTAPALTVGGNQTGTVNVNDGGNVVIGGNAQTINLNGGGAALVGGQITGTANGNQKAGQTGLSIPNYQSGAISLSSSLEALAANSTAVKVNQNQTLFTAMPDANGIAVFDIDSSFLTAADPSFVLNGAGTVIINVNTLSLDSERNFNDANIGAKIIWNFYDATSLNFGTEFGGTILAPYASVSNSNAIDGTVIANSLTQNGEIHLDPFTGTLPASAVPEAASLLMLLPGFAYLVRRRRSVYGH